MSGYLETPSPTGNNVWVTNTWGVFIVEGRQGEDTTLKFRSIKRIMITVGDWGVSLESFFTFKCKTPGKAARQQRQALETSNHQRRAPTYPAISSFKNSPGVYFPCKWSVENAKSRRAAVTGARIWEFHQWQSHFCTLSDWRGNHHSSPRASPVFHLCCAMCHLELKKHKNISRRWLAEAKTDRQRLLWLVLSCSVVNRHVVSHHCTHGSAGTVTS